jgi:hypothetical protein
MRFEAFCAFGLYSDNKDVKLKQVYTLLYFIILEEAWLVSLAMAVVCAETEGCAGLIMMGVSDNTSGCYLVQGNSCQTAGKAVQYSFRHGSKYETKTEAFSHLRFTL